MESNDAVETLDYNPSYSEEAQQDSSVKLAEREKITIKGGKIYAFFKRIFDIVCSLLAIIILAIPMLIVGIIVKCTSKGPMIFKDNRIGLNGKICKKERKSENDVCIIDTSLKCDKLAIVQAPKNILDQLTYAFSLGYGFKKCSLTRLVTQTKDLMRGWCL